MNPEVNPPPPTLPDVIQNSVNCDDMGGYEHCY